MPSRVLMSPFTYKLTCEYDGTSYHGWQKQPHHTTLQETIETALATITREHPAVTGASRTDAGVHAKGQVAHFQLVRSMEPRPLLLGMNALLPQDIAIKSIDQVDASFHARYQAKQKTYCYSIYRGATRSAYERHTAWYIRTPLHLTKMRKAAKSLIGKHDFTSLAATEKEEKNYIVEMKDIRITQRGERLLITLVASRFLRYMVRNIVGLLVEVGHGRRPVSDIAAVLDAKDRRQAGPTAPPHGLCLMNIEY